MSNIDDFAKRFSLLSEEDKQELMNLAKVETIKKEFAAHEKFLSERGYSIAAHSSCYTNVTFNKNIMGDDPVIHATLTRNGLGEWRCELSHLIGLLKLTTSEFSMPHPNFNKFFESKILAAAKRCEGLQPWEN